MAVRRVHSVTPLHYKKSFRFFYDFLFYFIDEDFLRIEFFRQEGLLLAYPSPHPMLINKTI